MINIDRYGNTTAGTIPLATRDAINQGRLKKGDLVLFAAVGAGYTVGASLWRWAYLKAVRPSLDSASLLPASPCGTSSTRESLRRRQSASNISSSSTST